VVAILFMRRRRRVRARKESFPKVLETPPLQVLATIRDPWLTLLLRQGEKEGELSCDLAADHQAALALARANHYDILLLEHAPGFSSIELCRQMRKDGSTVPILVAANAGTVVEVVAALDAGADNFLVGPLDYTEFLARLRVLQRRSVQYSEGPHTAAVLLSPGRAEPGRCAASPFVKTS
jgi:two-component system, OmpR family, copper resistance phosphate regulon response regulator CusR